jgi:hypothetical protein
MSVGIDWTSHALHCGEDSEAGGRESVDNRKMKRKMERKMVTLWVTLIFFSAISISLSRLCI